MSNLSIKAVEMVRSIRDAHYEIIKDLSPEEQAAFFLEEARALHAELGQPGFSHKETTFRTQRVDG